jgi:GT2 family glycosyltransferase
VLIVALGDSVTQGLAEPDRFLHDQVYHAHLKRLLEQRHPLCTFSVINAGADGQTAADGLARFDRDVAAHQPDLLLVTPDSVVDPGLVDGLLQWMLAHPVVGAAGPRLLNEDGTVQASARRFPDFTTAIAGRSSWLTRILPGNPLSRHNLPALEASTDRPLDIDWVSGACMLIRREAFDAVGGMDEGFFLYWEDADFCRRLKLAGWRTVYLPHITSMHIGGRSSIHAADASLAAFHRSAYRLFVKHASPPARLLSPLVYLVLQARLMLMRRIVRARRAAAEART